MKEHFVIIPKHGRDEYLRVCLEYLNQANSSRNSVTVLVCTDEPPLTLAYSNLLLIWVRVSPQKSFNKSVLLNKGVERALSLGCGCVSIVDVDMVYSSRFFDTIAETKAGYIVSGGRKLTQAGSDFVKEKSPSFSQVNLFVDYEVVVEQYPSQITLDRDTLELLIKFFGGSLYHEKFVGWGGEDSLLSFASTALQGAGHLKKAYINDMWYHLWHPKAPVSLANQRLFREEVSKLTMRIGEYDTVSKVNSNNNNKQKA